MRMSAGAATIVISRAGSTIFEIAAWGLPSIIIPITNSNGDHQRRNAFNYSRRGACVVIEEENLSSHLLLSEINRLMDDESSRKKMGEAAKNFFKSDAADKIALLIPHSCVCQLFHTSAVRYSAVLRFCGLVASEASLIQGLGISMLASSGGSPGGTTDIRP